MGPINFNDCLFDCSVDFTFTDFQKMALITGSKFLENVNFGQAQFRAPVIFRRVTFHKEVNFYSTDHDSGYLAGFENVKFKK